MHQPRDVGLQRMCTCGRVLRLAGVTPSDLKEKEKVRKEENERKMGKETEDAPPMVLFGLKFSRKDDPGELKTFLAKTCLYQQCFRQPPLLPVEDSSPAVLVHIGVPIQGLLRPARSGFAVLSDWWLATNSE